MRKTFARDFTIIKIPLFFSTRCCCMNQLSNSYTNITDSGCTQQCSGNLTETCGGTAARLYNIYNTIASKKELLSSQSNSYKIFKSLIQLRRIRVDIFVITRHLPIKDQQPILLLV